MLKRQEGLVACLKEVQEAAARSSFSIIVAVLQKCALVWDSDAVRPHVVGGPGDLAVEEQHRDHRPHVVLALYRGDMCLHTRRSLATDATWHDPRHVAAKSMVERVNGSELGSTRISHGVETNGSMLVDLCPQINSLEYGLSKRVIEHEYSSGIRTMPRHVHAAPFMIMYASIQSIPTVLSKCTWKADFLSM